MFWEQFYPTPKEIIDKMISKVENQYGSIEYKRILEPSAGKGDIAKALYWKARRDTVSVIEIDPNLRKILKDNGENIIGFDFLDFDSRFKRFDCIIMNPPFADGDKHFLKAWELLDGGVLVCLLNKETIDNPYSKTRQLLKTIIEDNSWEIEYLGQCFKDSERETDVEVVMVTIKKEKSHIENIFASFEEDYNSEKKNYETIDQEETKDIVQGTDKIEHIIIASDILKRQAIKTIIEAARFKKYEKFLWENFNEDSRYIKCLSIDIGSDINEDIKIAIDSINATCWSNFFHDTKICSLMTNKTYKDFVSEYSNSKMDFNRSNISKVIDILILQQDNIFEQSVNEVFDHFTKYHDENRIYFEGWKTNSAWKIWKKIILPRATRDVYGGFYELWYDASGWITDMDRVFKRILWLPEQSSYRGLWEFLYKKFEPWVWIDSDVLRFKLYKKGILHMEIKNKEIVDKINYIVCASRKWIPPTTS